MQNVKRISHNESDDHEYKNFYGNISNSILSAKGKLVTSVNILMTVTYWEIGRKVVEFQQEGDRRAKYGSNLIEKLSFDLTKQFGRGYGPDNLESMRLFYLAYPSLQISETLSRKLEKPFSLKPSDSLIVITHLLLRKEMGNYGKFTHADAGQMHVYLNYAREHWTCAGENPPVGLILCAQKDRSLAHYALDALPNKILAAEYKLVLPNEEQLIEELSRVHKMVEIRKNNIAA